MKIGFIGTGFIAKVHMQNLSEMDGVEIAGVIEPDDRRAQEIIEKYGAKRFERLEDMKDFGIDAVYITSPNRTHFEYAYKAVELGLNVFVEKPMTISLKDAKELERIVEEKGVVFQVGHNRRFAYVYKYMKEKIDSGEVKPHSFQIKMNRGELQVPPWVSDRSFTGGFLFETTLHLFDMMRYLFGDVDEMYVLGKKSVYEDYDDWAIAVKMKSGVIGTFVSSAHTSWMIPFERVEVYGEHKMLANDEMEKVYYSVGEKLEAVVEVKDYTKVDFRKKWGYVEEDELFVKALKGEGKPPVTVHDGVKAIEIVDACYRAVESGEVHVKF